ncbi:MAG TPA: immunoglobulin domain-containing protein, partial [Terracidiphilus sp.]|nr:immunoglobulin domain-containing protein [Terracidiphilus sp.]
VTFSVTGAGSPTLTYQWQRNGSDISGATSASYMISATSSADNGAVFTATVTNSLGSVTSNPAVLAVQ